MKLPARTVLTLLFLASVHSAHAIPVSNSPTPKLIEAPDLDGDGQPDTFGATATAALSQSGAAAHKNGSTSPVDTQETNGWWLALAMLFGVGALKRKMR